MEDDNTSEIVNAPGGMPGDTIMRITRHNEKKKTNVYKPYLLELMYYQFHHQDKFPDQLKWNLNIPTYGRSYTRPFVKSHKIKDVIYVGIKKVFEVTLANDYKLIAAEDQQILTRKGYIKLCDIKVMDQDIAYSKFSLRLSFSKVKSITPLNERECYNVMCEDPYHNLAINRIFIHN